MLTKTCAKMFGVAVLMAAILPSAAVAQEAAPASDLARMWGDFIHYIRIAHAEAALGYGQAILQANPDPRELYRISQQTDDLLGVLARGQRLAGLSEPIEGLRELIEQGYRQEARDAQQIARAIDMLAGGPREFQSGADRLQVSGEYAVPQLLARLADASTASVMRDRINTILPMLGKDAVRPLSAALETADPVVRESIVRALGRIGYPAAAPYLRRVLADPAEVDNVKNSAAAALAAVAGRAALERPVANLFHELAEAYYNESDSLRPDSRHDLANVWYWQEGLGLTFIEAPRAIFMDVYAMREARHALQADGRFYPAVSLWLAANLRREAHLPEGATDPTRPAQQVGADAFARAAGAGYMQAVLTRGLRDRDAGVAMGAIRALSVVAGSENLVRPVAGGAMPLVEALSFPNRRVRFMAADALAGARPVQAFEGDQMVVAVLVEALRQTGRPTAMVVIPDAQTRNGVKDMVRAAGYEVVDAGNFADALSAARQSSGVDVVVLGAGIRNPDLGGALATMRSDAMLAPAPVLVLAEASQARLANEAARVDRLVAVLEAQDLSEQSVQAGIQGAMQKSQGVQPIGEEEAAGWALRAAATLQMLADTGNPVFNIARAEPALVEALQDARDELKIASAWALGSLRSGSAQQALLELANNPAGSEEVRIQAYLAAAKSIRLIGKQMTDAQVQALVEVVKNVRTAQPIREAASAAMGAANLPSEQIESLITGTRENA